ncbi:hypothetical protein Peur_011612 [Populus x canadensis]
MAMASVIFVINGNVAFLAFSGSCYLKSIPAAVVNGTTPQASVRFWSSRLSLDLSVCCSCCPGERSNKWAISGRCLLMCKIEVLYQLIY